MTFDQEVGLPESMAEKPRAASWLETVEAYVAMKWPGAAAKSRASMIDALVCVTAALVDDRSGGPDLAQLRDALRNFVLPPNVRHLVPPSDTAAAAAWLREASLPLTELGSAVTVRAGLDALALKLDGTAAAATTFRRRRSVFYNVLQYAVELEALPFNPIDKVRVRSRRSKVVITVDRRVVINPTQARQLLAAVTYVGRRGSGERLYAFFACLYYAALRPSEALGLREQDCHLPAAGWGRLTLAKTRPEAGRRWTDSGELHDDRGLKHRGDDEPRSVPIAPVLVAILRGHLARYGTAPDGRIFHSERGNVVSAATYSRVWKQAREIGLTPQQAASPMAGRPYDLRHAAVSLWLNAGVPATEVAERAGHSVDVLLKIYATCIDGQEATVNRRIEDALGGAE